MVNILLKIMSMCKRAIFILIMERGNIPHNSVQVLKYFNFELVNEE